MLRIFIALKIYRTKQGLNDPITRRYVANSTKLNESCPATAVQAIRWRGYIDPTHS
jgi:hypothetical protein